MKAKDFVKPTTKAQSDLCSYIDLLTNKWCAEIRHSRKRIARGEKPNQQKGTK